VTEPSLSLDAITRPYPGGVALDRADLARRAVAA